MTTNEDILLREVDEDLQRDDQVAFAKRYGPFIGAVAAIVVAGVAGWQIWNSQQSAAQARSADQYLAALDDLNSGNDLGATALAEAASDLTPGYAALAMLRAGAIHALDGDTDAAVTAFVQVSETDGVPERLRDLARLRGGLVLVDVDPAAAIRIAEGVTEVPLQPLADEIIAFAHMATGNYVEAETVFNRIIASEAASQSLKERAQLFLPVVDAAEQGVPLEPEASEFEGLLDAFGDDFTQRILQDAMTATDMPELEEEAEPAPQ